MITKDEPFLFCNNACELNPATGQVIVHQLTLHFQADWLVTLVSWLTKADMVISLSLKVATTSWNLFIVGTLLHCTTLQLVLQVTTTLAWALLVLAAVATLCLAVLGVMVVTTMATLPMEEVATVVTSVGTVALLQATMAMEAMEALLLAVSRFSMHNCR